eukprot:scaffold14260_cov200-Alexandrium_tamarense.AAC.5
MVESRESERATTNNLDSATEQLNFKVVSTSSFIWQINNNEFFSREISIDVCETERTSFGATFVRTD